MMRLHACMGLPYQYLNTWMVVVLFPTVPYALVPCLRSGGTWVPCPWMYAMLYERPRARAATTLSFENHSAILSIWPYMAHIYLLSAKTCYHMTHVHGVLEYVHIIHACGWVIKNNDDPLRVLNMAIHVYHMCTYMCTPCTRVGSSYCNIITTYSTLYSSTGTYCTQ